MPFVLLRGHDHLVRLPHRVAELDHIYLHLRQGTARCRRIFRDVYRRAARPVDRYTVRTVETLIGAVKAGTMREEL